MSRKTDAQLAAYAALGRALGETIGQFRPTARLEVAHKIEYGLKPKPLRVEAQVQNGDGMRWWLSGISLVPGQPHYMLPGFPAAFLLQPAARVLELSEAQLASVGQVNLALDFDW